MPSTTKILLAGLMAAATAQAQTDDQSFGPFSATDSGLKLTVQGTSKAIKDNNKGGDSTMSITTTAEGYGFKVMLEPSFTITTKDCKQAATSPVVSLDMQMTLPAAFTTALATANTAAKLAQAAAGTCVTNCPGIGISVASLQQKFTFTIPFAKLASFKLSEVTGNAAAFKTALGLTGSDIVVKVAIADMAVYKAGNAIPLTATMTVGDATKMAFPTKVCSGSDGMKICAADSGTVCQALCSGAKTIAASPITATIDFPKEGLAMANALTGTAKTAALKYFAKCGPKGALTKDCFSLGDTTKGACVKPPPPTTTTAAAAAKSGASTTVMSAVVAGASLMMALMM